MPILSSSISPADPNFLEQKEAFQKSIDHFRSLEQCVITYSQRAEKKFRKRGQLLPRERLARLLDPNTLFLELSTLAGLGMHDDDGKRSIAGGGNIIGIGYVKGVRCLITISDSAIKGGAISPMGLRKTLRAQEIAMVNKLPVVSLVESAGANLLHQAELFIEGGKVFCNMARLSAAGIPQITVVHGSSTAGGAYIPGLSDYVVVVKDRAQIYLAGPPLVKAALGEDADAEELGGAMMHSTITGTAEYLAEDDGQAIHYARDILSHIGWNDSHEEAKNIAYKEPRYPAEDLLGIVPLSSKKPYDVREVIARIVDDSDFLEFKQRYGIQTVCGHARICGMKVGIIGNNGPIYPQGATKAAHFIQACCQSNTPILYLHNITGYMVGKDAEQAGIVKHGSKMIQAVSNASVPQISIIIGGSFGAGNYGMCGRAFDPRFIFSWPNAKISVMGGEQAAGVLEIILSNQLAKQLRVLGLGPDDLSKIVTLLRHHEEEWPKMIKDFGLQIVPAGLKMVAQGIAANLKKMGIALQQEPKSKLRDDVVAAFSRLGVSLDRSKQKSLGGMLSSFCSENELSFAEQPKTGVLQQLKDFICNQFDSESTALFATARIWDDGIIDPRDTRIVVAECLSTCLDASKRTLYPNSFGVARP